MPSAMLRTDGSSPKKGSFQLSVHKHVEPVWAVVSHQSTRARMFCDYDCVSDESTITNTRRVFACEMD